MEKIGAYYQCYRRPNSVDFVLSNFRAFYPESSLVMVCDGGDDLSEICSKYNGKYYSFPKLETEKNLVFSTPGSAIEFIQRLAWNIVKIQEDFILLLEDDVLIKGLTDVSNLKFDINGCNFNEFLFSDKGPDRNYIGACGGSILKKSFFVEIFSNWPQVIKSINFYCSKVPTNCWASDRILSYLCWANNGTIGNFPGFCETWYGDYALRVKKGDIEVLHQYKELYGH